MSVNSKTKNVDSTKKAKGSLVRRPEVFDLYWRFAAGRQKIFESRLAGLPAPWTNDPIFRRFKFCNVFRAADRISQFLIRDVIYNPRKSAIADKIFQIIAFRTFSKSETWIDVTGILGRSPTLEDLHSGAFERALDSVKTMRGGLYTGAFILCATKAFGFDEKHKNHVALFKQMFFECDLAKRIQDASSLQELVALLETFPLTGPFMSYQIAIDLNYSEILDFDENDFTQAGPGALRGIQKAFLDVADYTPAEVIMWMVNNQEKEFQRLGIKFDGLFGRRMHAIDCQGLFCELDKYCREAVPELSSARSRIKAVFQASPDPIKFFFPPKWKLNAQIARLQQDSAPAPELRLFS